MAGSGVTHLVVKFDGYGDEGQIEGIEARRGDHEVDVPQVELTVPRVVWGQVELGQESMELSQLAEHLAYDLLTLGHEGWQDSDGSFGDFTFDVAARTISLDFNARFTSSENSTYEH